MRLVSRTHTGLSRRVPNLNVSAVIHFRLGCHFSRVVSWRHLGLCCVCGRHLGLCFIFRRHDWLQTGFVLGIPYLRTEAGNADSVSSFERSSGSAFAFFAFWVPNFRVLASKTSEVLLVPLCGAGHTSILSVEVGSSCGALAFYSFGIHNEAARTLQTLLLVGLPKVRGLTFYAGSVGQGEGLKGRTHAGGRLGVPQLSLIALQASQSHIIPLSFAGNTSFFCSQERCV